MNQADVTGCLNLLLTRRSIIGGIVVIAQSTGHWETQYERVSK